MSDRIYTTILARRASFVAGLALLAVVSGALWLDDRAGLGASRPTSAQIDADCPSATTTPAGNTADVAGLINTDSQPALLGTSIAGYRDLYDLTWHARWIVRGRVVADCTPPGTEGASSGQTSTVIVQVDAVYRGPAMRSIVVAKQSDPMSLDPRLTLQTGEEVVLFLGGSERGIAWPLGGPQGIWRVAGGRVAPAFGLSPTLTLDEFPRAIAATLRGQPASLGPNIVSLSESPPGPDLPAGDVEPPSGCGGVVPVLAQRLENASDLAWVSDQIVFGTVIERQPSVVVDQPITRADRALRPVVTDTIIQVDQRLRGQPLEALRVRQLGGQIGDCGVDSTDAPAMAAGDHVLLFLTKGDSDPANPVFLVVGGQQGFWQANADGTLISQVETPPSRLPQILPSDGLTRQVLATLAGEQPRDEWVELDPIPLEAAPLGNPSLPLIAPGGDWPVVSLSSRGDTVRQPPGWTIFTNGPGGITSLTSWPARAPDDLLPSGSMRVDIRRIERPSRPAPQLPPQEWPFGVGQAAYPATIVYAAAYNPAQPAPPEQIYWVTVRYEVDDAIWEVRASLKQQPDLASSDLLTLFAILASVEHGQ